MSFSNLLPGPVVSINQLKMKQATLNDILGRGLIVVAEITDKEHETFKIFKKSRPKENPVMVFVTIQYLYNYD